MLLGLSVALVTAASLHFTLGERFHQRYGNRPCGPEWKNHLRDRYEQPGKTGQDAPESFNQQPKNQ